MRNKCQFIMGVLAMSSGSYRFMFRVLIGRRSFSDRYFLGLPIDIRFLNSLSASIRLTLNIDSNRSTFPYPIQFNLETSGLSNLILNNVILNETKWSEESLPCAD